MLDPTPSESTKDKSKLKGLVAQGLIGAVSLAGATAIPIVIKQVLEKPATPTTPAAVVSPVPSPAMTPITTPIASPIASPSLTPVASPIPTSPNGVEVNTLQSQQDQLLNQTESNEDNRHPSKGKGRGKDKEK